MKSFASKLGLRKWFNEDLCVAIKINSYSFWFPMSSM